MASEYAPSSLILKPIEWANISSEHEWARRYWGRICESANMRNIEGWETQGVLQQIQGVLGQRRKGTQWVEGNWTLRDLEQTLLKAGKCKKFYAVGLRRIGRKGIWRASEYVPSSLTLKPIEWVKISSQHEWTRRYWGWICESANTRNIEGWETQEV